jgi:hypothetical protein
MAQRKETKKKVKVSDLKPKKDAKGGRQGNQSIQGHNQSSSRNQNQGRSPTMIWGG